MLLSFIGYISHKASRPTRYWRREAWKSKPCHNLHSWWSSPSNWYEPSRLLIKWLNIKNFHLCSYAVWFFRIIIWKKHWNLEIYCKSFIVTKGGGLLQYLVWGNTYSQEGSIFFLCFMFYLLCHIPKWSLPFNGNMSDGQLSRIRNSKKCTTSWVAVVEMICKPQIGCWMNLIIFHVKQQIQEHSLSSW